MENIRTKFALDNLAVCKEHAELLEEWEMDFIFNTCENDRIEKGLSQKEFNILHDIASRLKKRFFKELAG